MKNLSKKTLTILFASLIAAMILPFSGMQMASADSDRQDKINKLGNAFEKIYFKYVDEDNPKTKASLKKAMDNVVKDLEEYGITYTEKWESNKAYWGEKSSEYLDEPSLSTQSNLLPVAYAYTDPYFYAGAAYECWWVLTCHV